MTSQISIVENVHCLQLGGSLSDLLVRTSAHIHADPLIHDLVLDEEGNELGRLWDMLFTDYSNDEENRWQVSIYYFARS
jgi:hypothetical protein